MKTKDLKLAPLQKALSSLERAIQQPINEFSRDSVIQRFEYTFELCWKYLQRVLEADRPSEDPSIKGILREAAKQNLIQDLDLWFKFHESRNLTSHTYNENTAQEVYNVAIKLPEKAHQLLEVLKKKIAEG